MTPIRCFARQFRLRADRKVSLCCRLTRSAARLVCLCLYLLGTRTAQQPWTWEKSSARLKASSPTCVSQANRRLAPSCVDSRFFGRIASHYNFHCVSTCISPADLITFARSRLRPGWRVAAVSAYSPPRRGIAMSQERLPVPFQVREQATLQSGRLWKPEKLQDRRYFAEKAQGASSLCISIKAISGPPERYEREAFFLYPSAARRQTGRRLDA